MGNSIQIKDPGGASKVNTNSAGFGADLDGCWPKEKQGFLVRAAPSWPAASFPWFCNLC